MQNLASPVILKETTPSGGDFPRSRGEFGQVETTGNLGREELSQVRENCGIVNSSDGTNENGGKKVEESETSIHAAAIQARAPKKSVSINEDVEEIMPSKNRKRMKKMSSRENEEEELKPLKSILKVGSRLNEKCDSGLTNYEV